MKCELCGTASEKYRIIKSNKYCFSIVSIEPVLRGHVMVLPRRHVETSGSLTPKEAFEINNMIDKVSSILRKRYNKETMTFLQHGSLKSQKHLHYHLVPVGAGFRTLISKYFSVPERARGHEQELEKMAKFIKGK